MLVHNLRKMLLRAASKGEREGEINVQEFEDVTFLCSHHPTADATISSVSVFYLTFLILCV